MKRINMKLRTTLSLSLGLLAGAMTSGCAHFTIQAQPDKILHGTTSSITVRGNPSGGPKPQDPVSYEIADGLACGTLSATTASLDGNLTAGVTFTASNDVTTTCFADLKVTINGRSAHRTVTVVPPQETTAVEPSAVITILLVASFAVDQLVTLLMLFLGLGGSAGVLDRTKRTVREKKIYLVLAGVLGLLLGYFGNIRILEGLGFSGNVPLNAILTALILMAGSDGIAALLSKMGSGREAEAKPLQITGTLALKRPERSKAEDASKHEAAGE